MMDIIHHSAFSIHPLVLILAFLLDLAIGDPRWLPHPVRIMGRAIAGLERALFILERKTGSAEGDNRGTCCVFRSRFTFHGSRFTNFRASALPRFCASAPPPHVGETIDKIKGVILVLFIVIPVLFITYFIVKVLLYYAAVSPKFLFIYILLVTYLVSTTIALKELVNSGRVVIKHLKNDDIKLARESLSMIVGRDTKNLSEKGILKATIETLSENLSDGVIAPLFYLTLGGIPLAMAYKAVNTLDSMVGYMNDKYKNFGWAAARLDDIANFIPARISGILIVVMSFIASGSLKTPLHSLKTMLKDGRKHLSPNSGMPEAAMAGALGVILGGPSTYNGILIEKPFIGVERTDDYITASQKAIDIVWASSFLGLFIALIVLYLRSRV